MMGADKLELNEKQKYMDWRFSLSAFLLLSFIFFTLPPLFFFSSLRNDGDVDLPEFAIAFRTHTHSLHNYTYDIDDELICALAFIDRFNFDVYDSRLTTIYPNSITANRWQYDQTEHCNG